MSNPDSPQPNDPIAEILRQAELKRLQLVMNAQFHKNMLAFQKAAPAIFAEYVNYQPQSLRLSFSPEGHVTLVNATNNSAIYPANPKAFCEQQLAEYKASPFCLQLNFNKSGIANPNYIHAPLVNELLDSYQNQAPANSDPQTSDKPNLDQPIGFMIIAGLGLGYHAEQLVEQHNIVNLMIVEPNKDSFYASLHTIDWEAIISKQSFNNKSLRFCIAASTETAFAAIKLLPDEIGLHNLTNTFLYCHLNTAPIREFKNALISGFHQLATGVGFFDDEQVSLAHTNANLKKSVKLLSTSKTIKQACPAYIVGNGPSLDLVIEQLKNNRNGAAIFSCGTALGSLYKAGIKPDYHIEMERTLNIREWITLGSTPEFRKGITLLTLNTCPPSVIDLFDEVMIARKPNDLGGELIGNLLKLDEPPLSYCGPTVSNCALAYAIALGYHEVYLLGTDLGMKASHQHHSNLSLYKDIERAHQQKQQNKVIPPWVDVGTHRPILSDKTTELSNTSDTNASPESTQAAAPQPPAMRVKGNKCDWVETTVILDTCRTNMESLMGLHPEIEAFNPNDGAFIQHAKTIDALPGIKNTKILADLSKHCHAIDSLSDNAILNIPLHETLDHIKKTKTLAKTSSENIHNDLDKIYASLRVIKDKQTTTYLLLKGSFNAYLAIIARYTLYCKNTQQRQQRYKTGVKVFRKFLQAATNSIKSDHDNFDISDNRITDIIAPETLTKNQTVALAEPAYTADEFNTLGYTGPFKVDSSIIADNIYKSYLTISTYPKTLNRHNDMPSVQQFLSSSDVITAIATSCDCEPLVWGSGLRWHIETRTSGCAPYNLFRNRVYNPIEYGIKDDYYHLMFALTDHDSNTGGIEIIPGSHKIEVTDTQEIKAEEIDEAKRRVIYPKKGEFYLLHTRLRKIETPRLSNNNAGVSLIASFVDKKRGVPEYFTGY